MRLKGKSVFISIVTRNAPFFVTSSLCFVYSCRKTKLCRLHESNVEAKEEHQQKLRVWLPPALTSWFLAHYLLALNPILLHSLVDRQESSYLFCWLTQDIHTRPKQEWEEEKNEHTAALAQEFQNGREQGCFLLFCYSVAPPVLALIFFLSLKEKMRLDRLVPLMLPWLKRKLPLTLPWLHSICSKLWTAISKPCRFSSSRTISVEASIFHVLSQI